MIIVGAECGKTYTICGKIKYLLQHGVHPDEILVLSFSKNSASDLKQKINIINNDIKVSTFYSLGLNILQTYHHKKFMIEEQYHAIIERYFSEYLANNH